MACLWRGHSCPHVWVPPVKGNGRYFPEQEALPLSHYLPYFHQPIALLPACPHGANRAIDIRLRDLSIWPGQYCCRFPLGRLQQFPVANDVSHAKTRQSGLARAKEFAGAAQFQVEFRDLKPVIGAYHSI